MNVHILINLVHVRVYNALYQVVVITNLGQREKYNRSSRNFTDAFFMLFFIIKNPKCRAC